MVVMVELSPYVAIILEKKKKEKKKHKNLDRRRVYFTLNDSGN